MWPQTTWVVAILFDPSAKETPSHSTNISQVNKTEEIKEDKKTTTEQQNVSRQKIEVTYIVSFTCWCYTMTLWPLNIQRHTAVLPLGAVQEHPVLQNRWEYGVNRLIVVRVRNGEACLREQWSLKGLYVYLSILTALCHTIFLGLMRVKKFVCKWRGRVEWWADCVGGRVVVHIPILTTPSAVPPTICHIPW